MDALDEFYEECRMAPIPLGLLANPVPLPWWKRLVIPFAGLSLGSIVGLLVLCFPTHPSEELGAQAARALSQTQMRARPELAVTEHAQQGGKTAWSA